MLSLDSVCIQNYNKLCWREVKEQENVKVYSVYAGLKWHARFMVIMLLAEQDRKPLYLINKVFD